MTAHALRLLCALLLVSTAHADLIWSPETGWRAEGGVLTPLVATDSSTRTALDAMNQARAAEENGNLSRALSLYEGVAKKYPNSIYAGEALYRAGNLRLDRRQYYTAFEHFQDVVKLHPDTPHFNQVIGQQYAISTALLDGKHSYRFGLFPTVFSDRSQGITYAETILTNAPHSDWAPLALMNIARGRQLAGDKDEAKDALDRLINNYPRNLLASDAYLRLAQAYAADVAGPEYDQGSTKLAITFYEDFAIHFPQDPMLPSALKGQADMKTVLAEGKIQIADFYFHKRDNFTAARVFYNEAITTFPDSPVAATARQRLAEVDAAEAKFKPRKKFLGIF